MKQFSRFRQARQSFLAIPLLKFLCVLSVLFRVLREPYACTVKGFTKNTKEDTKDTK